jgi:acid phosphatase
MSSPHYIKTNDNKLSFLSLGDWGFTGLNQTRVADAMSSWSSKQSAKFVIALGDNFYHDGVKSVTDKQWENTFIKTYHHDSLIHIPWYAILGNHDYHQVPQAEIDYYYLHKNSLKPEENRWYMPDHNYTVIYEFDSATLQIVFIDTPILAVKETEETDKNGKWEVSMTTKINHLRYIEDTLKSSNAICPQRRNW